MMILIVRTIRDQNPEIREKTGCFYNIGKAGALSPSDAVGPTVALPYLICTFAPPKEIPGSGRF